MLSGEIPFQSYNLKWNNSFDAKFILKKILFCNEFNFKSHVWSEVSDDAKSLITSLLTINSAKRININQLLNHPWLSQKIFLAVRSTVSVGKRLKTSTTLSTSSSSSSSFSSSASSSTVLIYSSYDNEDDDDEKTENKVKVENEEVEVEVNGEIVYSDTIKAPSIASDNGAIHRIISSIISLYDSGIQSISSTSSTSTSSRCANHHHCLRCSIQYRQKILALSASIQHQQIQSNYDRTNNNKKLSTIVLYKDPDVFRNSSSSFSSSSSLSSSSYITLPPVSQLYNTKKYFQNSRPCGNHHYLQRKGATSSEETTTIQPTKRQRIETIIIEDE